MGPRSAFWRRSFGNRQMSSPGRGSSPASRTGRRRNTIRQNTTQMQMKMFLTRLGENGRMIITGDPSQIDLPRGVKSGLVEALNVLDNVEGIVTCRFKGADVVRHPLVQKIVEAYDEKGTDPSGL